MDEIRRAVDGVDYECGRGGEEGGSCCGRGFFAEESISYQL